MFLGVVWIYCDRPAESHQNRTGVGPESDDNSQYGPQVKWLTHWMIGHPEHRGDSPAIHTNAFVRLVSLLSRYPCRNPRMGYAMLTIVGRTANRKNRVYRSCGHMFRLPREAACE